MHVKDRQEWQKPGGDSLTAEQLRESAIKMIHLGPQAELMQLQYPPAAGVYLGGMPLLYLYETIPSFNVMLY